MKPAAVYARAVEAVPAEVIPVEAVPSAPPAPDMAFLEDEKLVQAEELDRKYTIQRVGRFPNVPVFKFLIYEDPDAVLSPDDLFVLSIGETERARIRREDRTRRFELNPGAFLTELDFFTIYNTFKTGHESEDPRDDECLALDLICKRDEPLVGSTINNGAVGIKIQYVDDGVVYTNVKPSRIFAWCGPRRDLFKDMRTRVRTTSTSSSFKLVSGKPLKPLKAEHTDPRQIDVKVMHYMVFNQIEAQVFALFMISPTITALTPSGTTIASYGVNMDTVLNMKDGDFISLVIPSRDIPFACQHPPLSSFVLEEDGSLVNKLTPRKTAAAINAICDELGKLVNLRHTLAEFPELIQSDETSEVRILFGDRPLRCVQRL